jgi:hypothetical protein
MADVIGFDCGRRRTAGLTAANRSLELGRRALILEADRSAPPLRLARTNGGVFHVGFRSVTTDRTSSSA